MGFGPGRTGEGEHRTVVVEVGGTVEQARAFDGGDGRGDLVDHFGTPRFGKVGDAFDEGSRHKIWVIGHWGLENWRLVRSIIRGEGKRR